MNILLKNNAITLLFVCIHFVSTAQKPKKTHDYEKFTKKVVFAMGVDITKWCPDEDAIKYISENAGKSVEELRKNVDKNKLQLKKDVEFLNNNNIYRNYSKITLNSISKKPVVADIILHCEADGKPYEITLENCLQTNISWYLGDRISVSGEAVASILEENEQRKKDLEDKKENGLLSKLEEKNEAHENKNPPANEFAYVGKKFPMQGTSAHTQFFKMNLTGQFLDGYIVDEHGVKKEMKIRYDAPEVLHNPNQNIMTEVNGSKSELTKNSVKAFYVGEQLFVYTGEFWDILLEEGAIRKLGRVVKDDGGNYITADLIQKQGLSPENMISLTLGFKNKMSEYVNENKSLATKIKDKEDGYKLKNIDKIISVYNKWYDENYPDEVSYLFKPKTEVSENTLEQLGKDVFDALKSENPENFKPFIYTMSEVERSVMKADIKEMIKREKSEYEWLGVKSNVINLIKEYQQTDTKNFELNWIELIRSERDSKVSGIEIFDVKVHVKVMEKTGYLKFKSGKFDSYWKVIDMRDHIYSLNPTPDEGTEEIISENYDSIEEAEATEGSEEVEAVYEPVNENSASIDKSSFIGTWTFSSYYENEIDKTSEYEMGFLEGKPIKISLLEDGSFLYQNGVVKKHKINIVRWDYIEAPDESIYVSPILITHYFSNGEEKAVIYDLTEITDKRLVMEDKAAQTKIIYQK